MKKFIIFFLLFLLLSSFAFKSLLSNLTTNLIDWRDYAYVTWVINQNINHLRTLDFQNLFNTSAFYPYTNTIFLSDTLITQAIIGLPFSYFTKNPVLIFNLVFISTFLLNFFTSFILFSKLFKRPLLAFVGSLAVVFSPFFYTQIWHFQMLNYWPFFLILFLMIREETRKLPLNEILVGILVAVQFLASVYLAFFSLVAIFVFLSVRVYKGAAFKSTLIKFIVIILTFVLIDGIFIKGYLEARKNFGIKREIGEYLTYSAYLSDYFFPMQNGILYQNTIVRKWQSYDKHLIGEPITFPGFILGSLAILGLIRFRKSKGDFSLRFSSQTIDLFFLLLMIIGFSFSLGFPYLPLVKYIPLFDTIRGTGRWSFLFYSGLIYFSVSCLNRIKSKSLLGLAMILLIIDVLPGKIVTYKDSYLTINDEVLKSICSLEKTVVLEIPVTHFDAGDNLAVGLSYITKRQLATLDNQCYLVNGYAGYDLPSIQKIKDDLISYSQVGNDGGFISTVKQSRAQYVSINSEAVPLTLLPSLEKTIARLERTKKIKHIKEGVYLVVENENGY